MFIVLEGMEGTGKSTVVRLLSQRLDIPATCEPYDPAYRQLIMEREWDKETEADLFAADRARHQPFLRASENVICDRYIDSNIVYQGILGGLGKEYIQELNCSFIQPDIVFVLDVDESIAKERILQRKGNNRFDDVEKLTEMRETYLSLLDENHVRIDSNQPVECVVEQIISVLRERELIPNTDKTYSIIEL